MSGGTTLIGDGMKTFKNIASPSSISQPRVRNTLSFVKYEQIHVHHCNLGYMHRVMLASLVDKEKGKVTIRRNPLNFLCLRNNQQ